MFVIISLDDPEMALGVEGQTLLFTTEDEAREFCVLRFGLSYANEYGVIEAPADITGLVVA